MITHLQLSRNELLQAEWVGSRNYQRTQIWMEHSKKCFKDNTTPTLKLQQGIWNINHNKWVKHGSTWLCNKISAVCTVASLNLQPQLTLWVGLERPASSKSRLLPWQSISCDRDWILQNLPSLMYHTCRCQAIMLRNLAMISARKLRVSNIVIFWTTPKRAVWSQICTVSFSA